MSNREHGQFHVILRSPDYVGTTKHVLSPAQYQSGTKELTTMRSFIRQRRTQDDTGCQILRGVYRFYKTCRRGDRLPSTVSPSAVRRVDETCRRDLSTSSSRVAHVESFRVGSE